MWLNDFKIAIVEKDPETIEKLLESMPIFDDNKDMESVAYLLREASILMITLKDETSESLIKLRKTIKFIDSTHSKDSSLFNSKV